MKTSSIQVPSTSDYPEITEIWEASVRATHDFLTESDIQFFKPLILNEYLPAVKLFCIKNEACAIKGFMGLSHEKVEMLFIHPHYFGEGMGKLLIKFAIDEIGIRKLDVNEQNIHAVGFYKHLGFRVIGRSEVDGLGKPYPILMMEL